MLRFFICPALSAAQSRRGVTASEYAILAVALVTIIIALGQALGTAYGDLINSVTGCAGGGACGGGPR